MTITCNGPAATLLAELAPDLDRCNKCGFCQAGCPTFKVTGLEWLVTRGRVSLVQDALRGELPLADIAPAVDTCLLCRACMDHCPPKVPIDYLMTRARQALRTEKPLPVLARLVLRRLLPNPGLLRLVARVGAVGEGLGLRTLALRLGLLRRWPTLQRAAQIGPRLPGVTARQLVRPVKQPQARATVAYFITCTRDVVTPGAARAAVRVLAAAGCNVLLPQLPCCGLPCHSLGDIEGARALGREHLRIWRGIQAAAIVVDEGSCAAHLADLPHLFRGQPEEAEARQLAGRIRDLATFLVELGPPPPRRSLPQTVTWHDPCHLRNYLKVADAPRQLLRAAAGPRYVEAGGSDLCCGGAGAYMLTQPQLSDQVLDLKFQHFNATHADLLVTSSPSCFMQLERGARQHTRNMRVMSLAEFLELIYCEEAHHP